jgi:hypothetical protein
MAEKEIRGLWAKHTELMKWDTAADGKHQRRPYFKGFNID